MAVMANVNMGAQHGVDKTQASVCVLQPHVCLLPLAQSDLVRKTSHQTSPFTPLRATCGGEAQARE